jgi:hypothetical protein
MKRDWRTFAVVGMGMLSFAALPACDGAGDPTAQLPRTEDGANPEAHLAVQEAAAAGDTTKSCYTRSDLQSFVTVRSGNWGDWAPCFSYCPEGGFAYEAQLKSEAYLGKSGDDTAANALGVHCFNRSTIADQGWITSSSQKWGNWGSIADTVPYDIGNPWIGAIVGFSRSQGSGDDTAVNKIGMYDLFSGVASGGRYPSYATDFTSDYASGVCPAGTAICGIRTQIEAVQVIGDNTAMNGLAIACCRF